MNTSFDVRAIYSLMHDNHIQFSYKGPITQDVLVALGDTIKEKLHRDDCDAKVIRRVFSVLVETAHNILKYSQEKTTVDDSNRSIGVGLIGIGKTQCDTFLVFSGNLVTIEEAARIEKQLEIINHSSRDELNKIYHNQLKHGKFSSEGGAGLGLYEIARKSDNPIEYLFTEVNEEYKFFELKILIKVED